MDGAQGSNASPKNGSRTEDEGSRRRNSSTKIFPPTKFEFQLIKAIDSRGAIKDVKRFLDVMTTSSEVEDKMICIKVLQMTDPNILKLFCSYGEQHQGMVILKNWLKSSNNVCGKSDDRVIIQKHSQFLCNLLGNILTLPVTMEDIATSKIGSNIRKLRSFSIDSNKHVVKDYSVRINTIAEEIYSNWKELLDDTAANESKVASSTSTASSAANSDTDVSIFPLPSPNSSSLPASSKSEAQTASKPKLPSNKRTMDVLSVSLGGNKSKKLKSTGPKPVAVSEKLKTYTKAQPKVQVLEEPNLSANSKLVRSKPVKRGVKWADDQSLNLSEVKKTPYSGWGFVAVQYIENCLDNKPTDEKELSAKQKDKEMERMVREVNKSQRLAELIRASQWHVPRSVQLSEGVSSIRVAWPVDTAETQAQSSREAVLMEVIYYNKDDIPNQIPSNNVVVRPDAEVAVIPSEDPVEATATATAPATTSDANIPVLDLVQQILNRPKVTSNAQPQIPTVVPQFM